MVYKIGNLADLETLPLIDDTAMELLHHHASILSHEYGENRDVNENDGGYILFAPLGADSQEIKAYFDFSAHAPECVNTYGALCEMIYLLNNDFAVVIIMPTNDAPTEILKEIDN